MHDVERIPLPHQMSLLPASRRLPSPNPNPNTNPVPNPKFN